MYMNKNTPFTLHINDVIMTLESRWKIVLKRMSIKVSEDLYNYIANEAESNGLSMNAVIIFALTNYKNQNSVVPNMELLKDLIEKAEK